jgi:hypothetical protein
MGGRKRAKRKKANGQNGGQTEPSQPSGSGDLVGAGAAASSGGSSPKPGPGRARAVRYAGSGMGAAPLDPLRDLPDM